MTYRIISTCGAIGYGFDENSLNEAMKMHLDLIAADAGSMDVGPYYLGKGVPYFAPVAVKRDFSIMLKAALKQNCPLILGSCGMSGDDPHLNQMLKIAKEVFVEQGVENIKVAVVSSHVEPSLLTNEIDKLFSLEKIHQISSEMLKESAIVGQMGIAPFIKALDEGAQVIFCGRACDVAIFAAPAIRHGVDPGLAFHAGHILECGALACEPGSASDILMAEFENDTVTFIAPNKNRKVTPKSIAAHSLYEESHPSLQYYPEGVLAMEHTEYYAKTPAIAGIRNSLFVHLPLSIKLEGSQKIGERYISLLSCKPDNKIPLEYIVYGRNGVQTRPITADEQEIAIVIKTVSDSETAAVALATIIKGYMLHYGYPNRLTTAGNIAFPMSPMEITFKDEEGKYTTLIVTGTREPLFIQQLEQIKAATIELAKQNFPEVYKQCDLELLIADKQHPLLFLETVGKTKEEAKNLHSAALKDMEQWTTSGSIEFRNLYTGEVYIWSLYHLLKNSEIIKKLFPVKIYNVKGKDWTLIKETYPTYQDIGIPRDQYSGSIDETEVNIIKKVEHKNPPRGYKPLTEMATVIRTKDAGVNVLTYDILFKSAEDFKIAINSNAFVKDAIAKTLGVPEKIIIGSFRVDNCNAIKISRYRQKVSGMPSSRDVFGAQQQLEIEEMQIPVYD